MFILIDEFCHKFQKLCNEALSDNENECNDLAKIYKKIKKSKKNKFGDFLATLFVFLRITFLVIKTSKFVFCKLSYF